MRVALLTPDVDDASGTNLNAVSHASVLTGAGHKVTIFAYMDGSLCGMPVEGLKQPVWLPLWDKPWRYLFGLLPPPLHIPLVRRSLSSLRSFDVVITYAYPLTWLGYYAKKIYGAKYIWYSDGMLLPELYRLPHEKLYFWLLKSPLLWRNSATNADLVAVETNFLREEFKRRFGLESIVIGSLLESCLFNPGAAGDEVRREYNLGEAPLILYVDAIEPDKNVEILLHSFELVRENVPNAKLVLIGKHKYGSYWRRIQRLSNASVIFIRYVPHAKLPAFYAASTLFATCTTWEEGLSHTAIEAQACGKPVVAFRLPAHEEVVKNGETGILVDNIGNAGEFASALLTLLKDPALAADMGRKAADWASYLADKGRREVQELLNIIER